MTGMDTPDIPKGRFRMRLLMILLALAVAEPAWGADKQRTDINMVVAFDRSESVDKDERVQQIEGLNQALADQRFIDAVTSGFYRRIGLSVIAWSSFDRTEVVLPWIELSNRADIEEAIRRINWHQSKDPDVHHAQQTDIALAISTGIEMLDQAPFFGSKQVINVIADGIDNFGRLAVVDRNRALDKGIVINGLIQASDRAMAPIKLFFKRQVIGGPSSFVQAANRGEAFSLAMLRKMRLEIALLNGLIRADGT